MQHVKVMERIKIFFVTIFLTLINVSIGSAAPAAAPPAPMAIPPPPKGDINQNLILLLICALLFGMYTIYKYNLKRKASM